METEITQHGSTIVLMSTGINPVFEYNRQLTRRNFNTEPKKYKFCFHRNLDGHFGRRPTPETPRGRTYTHTHCLEEKPFWYSSLGLWCYTHLSQKILQAKHPCNAKTEPNTSRARRTFHGFGCCCFCHKKSRKQDNSFSCVEQQRNHEYRALLDREWFKWLNSLPNGSFGTSITFPSLETKVDSFVYTAVGTVKFLWGFLAGKFCTTEELPAKVFTDRFVNIKRLDPSVDRKNCKTRLASVNVQSTSVLSVKPNKFVTHFISFQHYIVLNSPLKTILCRKDYLQCTFSWTKQRNSMQVNIRSQITVIFGRMFHLMWEFCLMGLGAWMTFHFSCICEKPKISWLMLLVGRRSEINIWHVLIW